MKKTIALILTLVMVFALFTVSAHADRMDDLVAAAKAANVVASMTVSVQETNNPHLDHQTALDKIIESNMTVKDI